MTNKEKFITEITNLIKTAKECKEIQFEELSEEAEKYFKELNKNKEKTTSKPKFTEIGEKIIRYMIDNEDNMENKKFKAADIASGLSIEGRSVGSSMRKLVNDGYVEKVEGSVMFYSLTSTGENALN